MNERPSVASFNQELIHRKRGVAGITSDILVTAAGEAFKKLDPRTLIRNPVMFVVELVSVLTTILVIKGAITGSANLGFAAQITFWLWFTVIFANFAEAVAEGRGKAQAENLRRTRTQTMAKRLASPTAQNYQTVPAPDLRQDDIVLVEAGDFIPSDGDVIERAGHPGIRRRPLGGDRRHARFVRLDQGAHHRRAGLDVPRPHDRAG